MLSPVEEDVNTHIDVCMWRLWKLWLQPWVTFGESLSNSRKRFASQLLQGCSHSLNEWLQPWPVLFFTEVLPSTYLINTELQLSVNNQLHLHWYFVVHRPCGRCQRLLVATAKSWCGCDVYVISHICHIIVYWYELPSFSKPPFYTLLIPVWLILERRTYQCDAPNVFSLSVISNFLIEAFLLYAH